MGDSAVSDPPILVIGATGRHGGTGKTVVDRLLTLGHPVRALVHVDDERAAQLRQRGAATVVADLHDRASLVPAIDGARAVYFTYPVTGGIVSAAANLASVLVDTNSTAHLVVMSMGASALDSPSRLGQAQAVAEEVFIWAGLSPTVLRVAGLFHENIVLLHGSTIKRKALIANSFGAARVPWIGGSDAAELAIPALLAPRPDSARISYPPPAEAISHDEVARIISAETGRDIRYQHIPASTWRSQLEEVAASEAPSPINSQMAQHISALGAALAQRDGPLIRPDPDTLAVTLTRPPLGIAEFVRTNLSLFTHTVSI